MPLNALLLVVGVSCLISLVVLGSTIALDAIISLTMLALTLTYTLSICCLIWRRLYGEPLPSATWYVYMMPQRLAAELT